MQLGGCLSRLISLNCFCESAGPGPPQSSNSISSRSPLPGAYSAIAQPFSGALRQRAMPVNALI
jgi:hypothetical protein